MKIRNQNFLVPTFTVASLSLRAESEEIWKSLETAEKSLNDMVSAADYDTTRYLRKLETTLKQL